MRLYRVSAQGQAAAVRGEGPAGGGVRHPAGRDRRSRPGGGVRTQGYALRHGVSGAAKPRAGGAGAGPGGHRGAVRIHGEGGVR